MSGENSLQKTATLSGPDGEALKRALSISLRINQDVANVDDYCCNCQSVPNVIFTCALDRVVKGLRGH